MSAWPSRARYAISRYRHGFKVMPRLPGSRGVAARVGLSPRKMHMAPYDGHDTPTGLPFRRFGAAQPSEMALKTPG